MSIGWLTCIQRSLLPHSLCRFTTANAHANRQMPIASVVMRNSKKKKERRKTNDKLIRLLIIERLITKKNSMKKENFIFTLVFILTFSFTSAFAQKWTQQTSNTSQNLRGCYFVNARNGWAVGENGVILHTSNMGVTWSSQTSGTTNDLQAVCFLDSLIGYSVGSCGTTLKTINGGIKWTVQMQNSASYCSSNPYVHDLRTIAMKTETMGTAAGISIGAIYTTNSFTNSTTPWSGNVFHIQKVPNSTKIFTCNGTNIIISNDYGATWSVGGNYATNVGSLNFGCYIDANNIFVCNGLNLFKYEWTGTNYAWVSKYKSTTFYLNSLEFLNQQKGYFATSTGLIYYTENSGSNWSKQTTPITTPLNRLYFVNDTTAWCVGDNGVILKYNVDNSISAVSEIKNENSFSIYPNPSHGQINIENSANLNNIKVTNLFGQSIYNLAPQTKKFTLQLEKEGIYLLTVSSDNQTSTKKVIIKH